MNLMNNTNANDTDTNKIEMSEFDKTYFKLIYLRDEFSKQIKELEEHNKTLDTRIKGFVAHIDEIAKAPDKVKSQVEKHFSSILNDVAQKTANQLSEKTQTEVAKAMKELDQAARDTTRALNDTRGRLTTKPIWWHLAFGTGSVAVSLILFFSLYFFVFNKRVDTIHLTHDVHQRLSMGDTFERFLGKLSKNQRKVISDVLFDVKKPAEVFSKEYKE